MIMMTKLIEKDDPQWFAQTSDNLMIVTTTR